MEQLAIAIESELLDRLTALACTREVAVEELVREALEQKAAESPERQPEQTAPARLSFIAAGRSNYTDTSVLAGEIGMGPPPRP